MFVLYGILYSIDDVAPGYSCLVPFPISLQEMLHRCSSASNYYRHPAAILSDIRVLYYNCMTYNEANSLLSQRVSIYILLFSVIFII